MKIGVVGLGYVGLPLVVAFCEEGHEVIGVDADTRVVEGLEARRSHIEDVPDSTLAAVSGRFHATTRYAELAKVDAILVAVPTPLTANREPDLQPLIASGTALADVLQSGPARGARIHHLPGYPARALRAPAGGVRPGRGT